MGVPGCLRLARGLLGCLQRLAGVLQRLLRIRAFAGDGLGSLGRLLGRVFVVGNPLGERVAAFDQFIALALAQFAHFLGMGQGLGNT